MRYGRMPAATTRANDALRAGGARVLPYRGWSGAKFRGDSGELVELPRVFLQGRRHFVLTHSSRGHTCPATATSSTAARHVLFPGPSARHLPSLSANSPEDPSLALLNRRRRALTRKTTFRSQLVLAKKGPLGKIWLAAHMDKKVPKIQIIQTNVPEAVENIQNPSVPMALRVSGHLLLGVVRVFSRKVTYLLTDCSEALVKIKDAFKTAGGVELAAGAGTKSYNEITQQQHDAFDDDMDLDADLTSQAMLFTVDDDDALAGIAIPDDHDDFESQAAQAADGKDYEEEGFGAKCVLDGKRARAFHPRVPRAPCARAAACAAFLLEVLRAQRRVGRCAFVRAHTPPASCCCLRSARLLGFRSLSPSLRSALSLTLAATTSRSTLTSRTWRTRSRALRAAPTRSAAATRRRRT